MIGIVVSSRARRRAEQLDAAPTPLFGADFPAFSTDLETRSVWCKKTSECSGIYQAPNSHYYCNPQSNQCQYSKFRAPSLPAGRTLIRCGTSADCNSGYTKSPWHSNCAKDKGTSYWKPEVKVAAAVSLPRRYSPSTLSTEADPPSSLSIPSSIATLLCRPRSPLPPTATQ